MKTIFFDMDGTLYDLYSITDFKLRLHHEDPFVFYDGDPCCNLSLLARLINKAKKNGYSVGIITWLPYNASKEYSSAVIKAKLNWLNTHLPSVRFDTIALLEYGTPKQNYMNAADDILIDDNETVGAKWLGTWVPAADMLSFLKSL